MIAMLKRQPVILLVEDNPADQKLTMRALSKNHVANIVKIVNDGVEALEYLQGKGEFADRKANPEPDLILMDINMPRMDGKALLNAIRSTDFPLRFVPVIMLTNSVHERDVMESYKMGANAYVQKPVTVEEFYSAMEYLKKFWLTTTVLPSKIN
jgi:CheY-like chemotaxis protein